MHRNRSLDGGSRYKVCRTFSSSLKATAFKGSSQRSDMLRPTGPMSALMQFSLKSRLTANGPNSAASNYKRIGQSDWTPSLIALQAGHTPNQSLHLGIGRFSVSQCKRQSAPRNSDLCFPRASPEQPTERGSRIRQLAIRLSGSIF